MQIIVLLLLSFDPVSSCFFIIDLGQRTAKTNTYRIKCAKYLLDPVAREWLIEKG